MRKVKRRKKNRNHGLTASDKILIAAILNTLAAIIELLDD